MSRGRANNWNGGGTEDGCRDGSLNSKEFVDITCAANYMYHSELVRTLVVSQIGFER